MKCFRKFICFSLATIVMCTAGQPVFASNNEDSYTQVGEINDIEMPDDSAVNYTEQREDGLYYITEKINGSNIESTFYKIDGEEKILESSILSTVQEGKVTCIETNSNGDVEQYTISVDQEDLTQAADNEKLARSKTYLRTDKYGISLVGKKVTIAIAAGAIVAVTPYVSLSIATKIIVSAIAGGAGSGVTALTDYLYVTSKVYRSKTSGKIYTRYENKYYLNSARTKYVGSWTFSKRLGH